MEAEGPEIRHLPHIPHGVFPALSAALFIAMGYIDLGKWAACIDSGVRFGGDLALFLFLFNLMAILCQYLSVHIGVVTGKNLAQICSAEYGQFDRIFLGIQAEVSILMSDLAMILGIANGLHMILKVDLFVAVILAALDAIFYPLLSTLLVNSKAKGLVVRIAGLIFVCYVLGLLIGLPEISISPIGMPSKLNGENVYAMISLLGANIMPHNFYLHSSIVQRFQGSNGEARAHWVYESFFSIFAIFSSIFLVNYVLMNSASNMLYSSEHVLSTFQDAMSLMNQSLWSPMKPLGFLLLISSSHISGLSWGINREGNQPILCDFFGIDLPGWLHCATVRVFATIPALYCLWYSGAEGMYQMLISTQIMMGLLLPASVVALCQIAASRAIMGASKISAVTEFFMMMSLMAMIGLQIIFLGEMVFGDSAWLGYLRWNMGTTSITSHSFILIFSGWASLCFTFRIFVTPLRSADERPNAQQWSHVRSEGLHVSLVERQENDMAGSVHSEEQFCETNTTLSPDKVVETHSDTPASEQLYETNTILSPEKVVETHSDTPAPNYGADLPGTIMGTGRKTCLTPVEEITPEEETALPESIPVPEVNKDWSDNQPVASNESKVETVDLDEKTPLRSADERPNALQVRSEGLHVSLTERQENNMAGSVHSEEPFHETNSTLSPEKVVETRSDMPAPNYGVDLPGTIMGTFRKTYLTPIEEITPEEETDLPQSVPVPEAKKDWSDNQPVASNESKAETADLVEKTPRVYDKPATRKDGEVGETREPEEVSKVVAVAPAGVPEGLSGRLDDGGNGTGLGRAARRQLAAALDEFWGHLYDYHGQLTQEAKANELNLLLGADSSPKSPPSLAKTDSVGKDVGSHLPIGTGRSDSPTNSNSYDSSIQLRLPSAIGSAYGAHKVSPSPSMWSNTMQEMRVHQTSGGNALNNRGIQYTTNTSPRLPPSSEGMNYQPAALHGNQFPSFLNQSAKGQPFGYMNDQREHAPLKTSSNGYLILPSNVSNYDRFSPSLAENVADEDSPKQYCSLPNISKYTFPAGQTCFSDTFDQLRILTAARKRGSLCPTVALRRAPPGFDEPSACKRVDSLWHNQPLEQFGGAANKTSGLEGAGQESVDTIESATSIGDSEKKLLQSLKHCILKLLTLEGSEWLFKPTDGADEDLIERVAARERFSYESECKGTDLKNMVSPVPHCGEGCVWKADLIVSFGVWCIHRILELSLTESRPELWGKYTYVLNRLQGVIDLAFFKQRIPMLPCTCLQIAAANQQRLSPFPAGALPPTARPPSGKFTTAPSLLDIIKDIEISISSRKGRSGTGAGDIAFPKGKENLASVLKRYKRRLSNKPVGPHDGGNNGPRPRKLPPSGP